MKALFIYLAITAVALWLAVDHIAEHGLDLCATHANSDVQEGE